MLKDEMIKSRDTDSTIELTYPSFKDFYLSLIIAMDEDDDEDYVEIEPGVYDVWSTKPEFGWRFLVRIEKC